VEDISGKVRKARREAWLLANREMITLFFDLGKKIAEREYDERKERKVIQQLSKDLRSEFKQEQLYSPDNIGKMVKFYRAYKDYEEVLDLVKSITWTANLALLERCKSIQEREFYLRRANELRWSVDVLVSQIENDAYNGSL
jgi:predicted nuclease of restriction endonuclease-like (RecB) superfamily